MTNVTVVRKKSDRVRTGQAFQFDYWMLLAVAGLLVVGMLMVYSTTFDLGLRFRQDPTYYFRRQFWAMLLGLSAMVVIMQFDYHAFRRISVPFLALTLLLLVVLLIVGEAIFGARRGLYEGSYQPSEVAKLATILYISHWLSSKGERITNLTYGLLPFSVITGVVCALIVRQPDLSVAILIAMISFTLFFVAGADWRQIGAAGAAGVGVFALLAVTLPHAAARVTAWRDVWRDPNLAVWQVQQAFIALGSGGLFGVGLGESTQKFGPLPAAHTDGAFAILGEELGLFGCLVVIGLLAMLVWRGVRASQRARDTYGFLLGVGVTSWLAFQSLINIAVITAVIPFTGIPLPFLSYGGTSIAVTLAGIGVLLNISRDAAMSKRVQSPGTEPKSVTETLRESFDLRRRDRRAYLSGPGGRR